MRRTDRGNRGSIGRMVKSASHILTAGLAVCLLGFFIGWGGGAVPATAQAGPVPVSDEATPGALEAEVSQIVDVDVVVFATQTSGLAAVRELAVGAPHLRVALISCGNLLGDSSGPRAGGGGCAEH